MMITGAIAACCISTGTASAQSQSPSWRGRPGAADYDYYLALGDSLAWGYQPNSAGVGVESGHGYADDLAAYLRQHGDRNLKYANLSCPGETTGTMLDGGCPDLSGSGQKYSVQVTAAAAFLKAHPHARILVTLDIGANNIDSCVSGATLDATCIEQGVEAAGTQLPEILGELKAAAGRQVTFTAMNYYDPFLAEWLTGTAGQGVAEESVEVSTEFNGVLDKAYAAFHVPVADVADAFKTTDFTDTASLGGTTVPINVADICDWTWMCAPAPVGPNIHADNTGYAIIARTFEEQLRH
jgi:lysophospholipase L1-like esterase